MTTMDVAKALIDGWEPGDDESCAQHLAQMALEEEHSMNIEFSRE